MEIQRKIELGPTAEGVIRCTECGQTSVCHEGDCVLYEREGWPRCPVDGRELKFIAIADLQDDPAVKIIRRKK